MKLSPGVVPQWPSSRGLMCSLPAACAAADCRRDRSVRPTGSSRRASRRRSARVRVAQAALPSLFLPSFAVRGRAARRLRLFRVLARLVRRCDDAGAPPAGSRRRRHSAQFWREEQPAATNSLRLPVYLGGRRRAGENVQERREQGEGSPGGRRPKLTLRMTSGAPVRRSPCAPRPLPISAAPGAFRPSFPGRGA